MGILDNVVERKRGKKNAFSEFVKGGNKGFHGEKLPKNFFFLKNDCWKTS